MLFLLYLMWIYSSKVPQKTASLEHLMFVAFQLFILQELRNVRKNDKENFSNSEDQNRDQKMLLKLVLVLVENR